MRKLKLLMAFCALLLGWSNASADVSLNAFSQVPGAWGGSGFTKNDYLVERYYESRPTGLIMAQAVSSIPNGTYDVVVIAHACHANGVGGVFVASNNTLSVNESSQTVATIDNSAPDQLPLTEYTFSNVSVTDGTMNIKFSSDAAGANWFTIRVKSVTLKGNFEDKTGLLTNADFSAQNADNQAISGWTTATTFVSHVNNDSFTGTFAEIWRASDTAIPAGELSQTVNLPAGVYALSANIRSRRVTSHLFATIGGKEQKHTHIGDDGVGVRSLTFVVNQASDVKIGFKNDENSTTGDDKWVAVDDIKITRLGDVGETSLTSQIANPSFESGDLSLWTNGDMEVQTNMLFAGIQGHIYAQRWHSEGYKSVKQTLSGIPSGRYRLTVNAQEDGGTGVKIYAGDKETTVTSLNDYNVDFICNGSDVEIGYKAEGTGSSWLAVDNFRLQYYGPCAASEAVALPDDGAMAADTWYYFDINAAADNYNATATTLSNIICTDDGNTSASAATGNVTLTATDNSFAAKRYYVKSSTANNLEISVASYTYSISEASADVSYIQAGNTVTVSYTVGTNDPSATLTQDYSGVTFGGAAISVTPTASGFTFTVPTVSVNTPYTLSIPEGAIKYNDENKNAAQNITLNTPAIFDGIYYLYNTYTENYLSRGGNYGTQAIMDNYGVPAYLAFDGEGKTRVKFFDNYKFLSDGGWLYADNLSGGQFFVDAVVGGYKFKDATNTSNYVAVLDNQVVGDAVEGSNLVGTSNVWSLETPAQYDAKDNATTLANAQAAAAATAAGIAGITTLADLESELKSNYGETNITITGAKAEKYDANGGSEPAKYVEETVNDLKPGIYRLTVDAFQRASSNDRVAAAGGASSLVYAYAGTAKTRIKSVMAYGATSAYASDYLYDGKHYPNDEASAYVALEAGNYNNTVYVYVADAGKGTGSLTFGINNPQNTNAGGYPNALWAVYDNFTLTYFEAKATAAEKKDLSDAINEAESHTLGFENGDYAPYNNVDALTKLAAAKAINSETASGEAVRAATTALTGATWTANAGEVNAIYWDYSTLGTTDKSKAYGWYDPELDGNAEGSMYSTRVFNHINGKNNDGDNANPGLGAVENNVALFTKKSTNYGKVEGYTLPLKANRTYKLSFRYAGWTEESESTISITDENGENPIAISGVITVSGDAVRGNESPDIWADYVGYFTVPANGNYVLNINRINMGGKTQCQLVMGNILLKSADALVFADGSAVPTYAPGTYPSVKITRALTAGRWATAVYPFAVSGVDNIAVLYSYDKETGALGFTSATASRANEPFFMRSETTKSEITLSNVAVEAVEAAPVATKSEAKLKGAYTTTNITNAEKNYVLSNNTIYSVGTAGATISPYRAYIQIAQDAAPARALSFFIDGDETTGIDGVEVQTNTVNGTIYNLNGQRVEKVQKGLYIVNGKKVVIRK